MSFFPSVSARCSRTSSEWFSDATSPLAVPTLISPISAHCATVRARATGSVCAIMSETRSASAACCHAPTKPKSMTRAGRHLKPSPKGPVFVKGAQKPVAPVSNEGGWGARPLPSICMLKPGSSSRPCFRRRLYTDDAPSSS